MNWIQRLIHRRRIREWEFHRRISHGPLKRGEIRVTNNSGRVVYVGGGHSTGWPVHDRETLWIDTDQNQWAKRLGDLPLAAGVKLEIGK